MPPSSGIARPPSLRARASPLPSLPSAAKPSESRLGPWHLTQVLRRGALTTLYRARPAEAKGELGCYVVKTFAASGAQRDLARAMLAREAAVGQAVNHPHLATVLAADLVADQPYVVRPYLDGITLRQFLDRQRSLPLASALWIARQVAESLTVLHRAGWLHGQVQPEHVIVAPSGHATLIDTSLCRRLETTECEGGDVRPGSIAYAAPETFLHRGRLTTASEIYSLGISLYEMLASRPPFQAADAAQLARLHRTIAPPDLRAARPDLPPEAAYIIRLMLTKEPLRRPSVAELVRWLAELEIAALAP
ncbi:MAG TPA: serine/threonine-protein kinase [Pirellulaceae bacterium]|nr:serine/threonine-protein kinase [Pirellulaceae bacterium]